MLATATAAGLLGFIGWVQFFRDEPAAMPPGFVMPAMLPTVPGAENGLVILAKEMARQSLPEPGKEQADILRWKQPWDANLMQPLVDAGPALKSILEQALRFPLWDVEDSHGAGSLYGCLVRSQNLLLIRARHLDEAGNSEGAMECLMLARSLLLRYQERPSSLAALMIGAGSRAVLNDAMLRILAQPGIPDHVLAQGMEFFDAPLVKPEALVKALAMDHFRELDTTFDMRSHSAPLQGPPKWVWDSRFKPQAYHNLKLRHLALLESLAFREGRAARANIRKARAEIDAEANLSLWSFDPNRAGRILAAKSYNIFSVEQGLFCQEATRRCVLPAIAAKRWSLAHGGKPPATLAELVPRYLRSIPLDPWDGRPLRWDAATGMVYTIGSDEVDDLPILPPDGRFSVSDHEGSAAWLP